jgi:soluble lytic murein transglycosylase-like protein
MSIFRRNILALVIVILIGALVGALSYQVKQSRAEIARLKAEKQELRFEQDTTMICGFATGFMMADNLKADISEIPEFSRLTVEYSNEFGLNCYEVMTICEIESRFIVNSVGGCGEQGPAQLMEDTWNDYYQRFGYKPVDFYNWKCNYRVAVAFYADVLKMYKGDTESAIGYYNGGGRWREKKSTQRHIKKYLMASRGGSLRRVIR